MSNMKKISAGEFLVRSFVIIYFISYITRLNFNAVLAEIISIGVMSKTEAGLVGTGLFIAYGVGQLISGFLGDRIKPQLLIGFGLGLTSVCNLLMPMLDAVPLFVAVWAVNGFAQAMMWPPMVKLMTDHLDKNGYSKGCVMITASSQIATVAIYILLVPLCLRFLDWRGAFWIPSACAAVILVVWYFVYREIARRAAAEKGAVSEIASSGPASPVEIRSELSFGKMSVLAGLAFILVAIVLQGFLRDGLTSWTPTFLTEAFGLDTDSAIALNVLLPLFSIVALYSVGFLFRKFFRNELTLSITLFAVGLVCCGVLSIFCERNAIVSLICAALITACMHGINLMLISYVPRHFGKYGKASTASGVTNAFTYVGSAASSYGFAALSDSLGWTKLVLVWGLVCLLGIAVLAINLKRWSTWSGESIRVGSEKLS